MKRQGTANRRDETMAVRASIYFLLPVFLLALMALPPPAAHAARSDAKVTPEQADLFRAVSRGKVDRVRALITAGVDMNFSISGMTPLMVAKTPAMIRLLARAGADVNARSELFKQTVLMLAVGTGKPDVVKALIEAGADVDARDEKSGMTALSMAVINKRAEMVRLLIKAGADPDGLVLDMPMLTFAAMIGNTDLMKALIEGGADLNVRNKRGATPLMAAVAARQTEAAKLLIEAGADVNARSYPLKGKRKRGRGGKSGQTAMDVAKAIGDREMVEMLEKTGARESDKPPAPDYQKPNTPGIYSLDCSVSGSPPPRGAKFSCSGVDQVADSGTETMVFSKAYFAGKHAVPMEEGCRADLGQPGFYTIQTTTMTTPWELVCRARLRTTTGGEKWIAFIRKGKTVIKTSEHKAVVKKPEKKAPKEEKEPPRIKIVKPVDSDQFVFNKDEPRGVLEIEAEAEVTGDCDDAATWEVEDIGESKKKFDPEGASDNVTIKFEDLPSKNSHFGKKKITARACGKSDSVTVEVFFSPEVKNHPGKASGETPNWFYYWGQTRAGKKFSPIYMEKHPCGNNAVGSYWFDKDKIALYPATFKGVCFERADGSKARGIDCYAETLIHESIHQQELKYWWNNIPTKIGDFDSSGVITDIFLTRYSLGPGSCSNPIVSISRNIKNKLFSIDSDLDLVPDYIEKGLAGCDPNNAFSCPGVPPHVMQKAKAINHKIDVDMNTYRISWKKWTIGDADKEDWSWCGKQWKDASVCPGGKTR